MLNKSSITAPTSTANVAGTNIDKAMLVSRASQERIIDTGATDHMVSDINLLNKNTIVETSNPKRYYYQMVIYLMSHTQSLALFQKETL